MFEFIFKSFVLIETQMSHMTSKFHLTHRPKSLTLFHMKSFTFVYVKHKIYNGLRQSELQDIHRTPTNRRYQYEHLIAEIHQWSNKGNRTDAQKST